MLHVPEKLPASRARHVAPGEGASGSSGVTLQRLLATPTEARSLRASTASPPSVRARSRRGPGTPASSAGRRAARPKPSRGVTSWDTRGSETSIRPARSFRHIQGQSESRSRARFSAGLRRAGSMWSGRSRPGRTAGMSQGRDASESCGSTGRAPPGRIRSSADPRSMAAAMDGRCQTRSPPAARTASRSSANIAGAEAPVSSLRAWRSRASSGTSTRTAPGIGPSHSLHTRLAKPVLSAASPCLTTARVRPPESSIAASMGAALYHRNRMG